MLYIITKTSHVTWLNLDELSGDFEPLLYFFEALVTAVQDITTGEQQPVYI